MANAINDAPGVDCAFTDAKDSDRRRGYFFTFAHPTSDVLAGWEGPPKTPTDFTKEEFYEHILRCYHEAYPGGFAKVSWGKKRSSTPTRHGAASLTPLSPGFKVLYGCVVQERHQNSDIPHERHPHLHASTATDKRHKSGPVVEVSRKK